LSRQAQHLRFPRKQSQANQFARLAEFEMWATDLRKLTINAEGG
jgi:hypothetical protein